MIEQSLSVFDPAMCCSTGVCGPEVDPRLARFSADLDWLSQQGVKVTRHNLAQQPGDFVAQPAVKQALVDAGDAALPMLLIGDRTVMSGTYPNREQLASWFGLTAGPRASTQGTSCSPKSGCCP